MKIPGLIPLLAVASFSWGETDLQTWIAANPYVYRTPSFNIRFRVDLRVKEQVGDLSQYIYGPTFRKRLGKNTSMDLGLRWIWNERGDAWDQAVKYHGQFLARVGKRFPFQTRTRYEYFFRDRGDKDQFRERFRLTIPVKGSVVQNVYFDVEQFYDHKQNLFPQLRVTPLGLKLKLTGKLSTRCYYLIQNIKGKGVNHVLASTFIF